MKLNNKHIKIQSLLSLGMKYEKIAEILDCSVGLVSNTEKEKIDIKKYEINNAVIWAAGWGSRLMPITENTPKPLVKVNGTPIIISIINALKRSGINNITLVLGRMAEHFNFLKEKYNVKIINNPLWETHNNISSYYFMKKALGNVPSYLIDGDMYVDDKFTYDKYAINSFAYSSFVAKSDDIVFKNAGKWIVNVSMPKERKEKIDGYQYKGVFYFNSDDMSKLSKIVDQMYNPQDTYESSYWFDAIWQDKNEIIIENNPVQNLMLHEIDTIEDLLKIDSSYKKYLERDKND